jgi:putative FmdB family regulatory protein
MPIYEYLCRACGHRTEILHGINDPGPQFCPACGAEGKLRKAITAPSVVFKGSGWAKKDRRPAASSKKSAGSEGETASTAAKSGDSAAASSDAGSTSDGKSSTSSGSGSAASSRTTDSGGD